MLSVTPLAANAAVTFAICLGSRVPNASQAAL